MVVCMFQFSYQLLLFLFIFINNLVYLRKCVTVLLIDTIYFSQIFHCNFALCCTRVNKRNPYQGICRVSIKPIIQLIMGPYYYNSNHLRSEVSLVKFLYCMDEKSNHVFSRNTSPPPLYEKFFSSFRFLHFIYYNVEI